MTSLTHLFVAVLAVPFALFSSPASSERESPDVHLLHNEGSWTLYYSGAYGGFSASCMIITSNADDETLLVDITNESFDISISLDPDSTVDAYIETGQEFISADLSFQIDRLEPWNLKSARLQPLVGEITFSFTQEAITKGAADALLTELSNGRVLNTAKRYWTLQGSAVVIHELRDCLSNLDSS